jgi:hypothetical protein
MIGFARRPAHLEPDRPALLVTRLSPVMGKRGNQAQTSPFLGLAAYRLRRRSLARTAIMDSYPRTSVITIHDNLELPATTASRVHQSVSNQLRHAQGCVVCYWATIKRLPDKSSRMAHLVSATRKCLPVSPDHRAFSPNSIVKNGSP